MGYAIFGDDDTCVKVYNPSTQKLIGVFRNYQKAANSTGLKPAIICQRCQSKTKVYAPLLKMKIAVRLSTWTESVNKSFISTVS